ncbi:hypothetical protein FNF28_04535 [Cafeteria roenbergensis]|uniref:DNA damage-binding protein 1 n=1 Tax=Cafeteria roenbergensis TaxID=33653 RepID=A0A5A8DBY5_CAFRO|nr:hypothetical protein FNF28_04535 [Cafeteria roenbergensis]
MKLYSLTLQRPSMVTCSAFGSFSGRDAQEFVVARGPVLELLRPDELGQVHAVLSVDTFSVIRDVRPFRLPGSHEDLVLVASDSGRFAVLRADEAAGCFRRVHLETFGKSGCRRITPGQFLAVDPRGRAAMLAATEKQKFAWLLSRDTAGGVTVSSPLEAHRPLTLCLASCGLDVGFESPTFACLERGYEAADADPTGEEAAAAGTVLAAYELDLGLNHVSRRWAEETDRMANAVLPVPGGSSGPGGALVLAEGWVLYHSEGQPPIRAPVPRRRDLPDERGVLLTAHCCFPGGVDAPFVAIAQSEYGDLYRLSVEHAGAAVSALSVQYIDTIAPCSALALSPRGLLLASADSGDQLLYEFRGDAAADPDPVVARVTAEEAAAAAEGGEVDCPVFKPRPLSQLALAGSTPELAPLAAFLPTSSRGDGETRLVALAGRGPRAAARTLRHGAPATDLVVTKLPGVAAHVHSVRVSEQAAQAAAASAAAAAAAASGGAAAADGADGAGESAAERASAAALACAGRDRLIVVSFVDASLAMQVAEDVEELHDSGLREDAPTLAVGLLDDGSLVQVHRGGMLRIRGFLAASVAAEVAREMGHDPAAVDRRTTRWVPPGNRGVLCGCVCGRQVLVGLDDGSLLLFELDPEAQGGDSLVKVAEQMLATPALALDAGERAPGARLCPLLAVVDVGPTLRVLSLSPSSRLKQLAAQALPSAPTAVCMADLRPALHKSAASAGGPPPSAAAAASAAASAARRGGLSVLVGLASGTLLRSRVDEVTGRIAESTSRTVGASAVKLCRARLGGGRPAVLALSSRPWVVCMGEGGGGRFVTAPLATVALDGVAALSSADLPEGLVAVEGGRFRVLTVDQLGGAFAHDPLPLRYTPRRVVEVPAVPALMARLPAAAASSLSASSSSSASAAAAGAAGAAAAAATGAASAGSGLLCVLESDHNAFTQAELEEIRAAFAAADAEAAAEEADGAGAEGAAEGAGGEDEEGEEGEEDEEGLGPDGFGVHPARVGRPVPPEGGQWASCLRLVDTSLAAQDLADAAAQAETELAPSASLSAAGGACTLDAVDLPSGCAALSACAVCFAARPGEVFVAVGVVAGLAFHPMRYRSAGVRLYHVVATPPTGEGGPAEQQDVVPAARARARLAFLHETPVDAPPLAMCGVAGRLLVGVGPAVVTFEIGIRQLLRRGVSRVAPTRVVALAHGGATSAGAPLEPGVAASTGVRVWCGDAEEGLLLLSYRPDTGSAVVIADELTPRHVTACGLAVIDGDTAVVGDKFGTLAVVRAPEGTDDDGAAADDGTQKLWAASPVRGAATKLVTECQAFVGGAVTAVAKGALAGGHEVIVYATVTGAVGALLPLTAKSDTRLLEHLELYLRARAEVEEGSEVATAERLTPTGRVHIAYRSYFAPVKHVVDGDLCERFLCLPEAQRLALAEELSSEGGPVVAGSAVAAAAAVARRLEEMRARVM